MDNYYHYQIQPSKLTLSSAEQKIDNLSNGTKVVSHTTKLRHSSDIIPHYKKQQLQQYQKKILNLDNNFSASTKQQCENATLKKLQKYLQYNKSQKNHSENLPQHYPCQYVGSKSDIFQPSQYELKQQQDVQEIAATSSSFESSMKQQYQQPYEMQHDHEKQPNFTSPIMSPILNSMPKIQQHYEIKQQFNQQNHNYNIQTQSQSNQFQQNYEHHQQQQIPLPVVENLSSMEQQFQRQYHSQNNTQQNTERNNIAHNPNNQTLSSLSTESMDEKQITTAQNQMTINNDSLAAYNSLNICLCSEMAYGEMINCDNVNCVTGQYHFECVNLIAKPIGQWICPICQSVELLSGIDIGF